MAYSSKDIARANAKQQARLATWKQEANAYASSKGVTLPGNFVDLALNQGRDVDYSGKTKNTLSFVDSYIQDKNAFQNNAIKNKTYEYVRLMYGVDASAADRPGTSQNARKLELESFIRSAALSGVPISSIQSSIDAGQNQFSSYVQDDKLTQLFTKVAIPIALSFALPGMGSAIGAQLTAAGLTVSTATATAIGTAMASTAIQMAQGVDFETALKNATVNAVIQTGSPSVATEINKLVKIPAVSDAITSAGASALKTAASGGSAADIEKNMIGAIAGSATASATGSNIAGAAVGGGVTGGAEGAAAGAAGAYASQLEAERIAKEKAAADAKAKPTASVDYEKTVNDLITKELNQVMLAGGGAAAEMSAYARALENANKPLLRLVQEAANDPNYVEKLDALEKSLFKTGTSISKVLGLGFELLTYSPELNKGEMDYFKSQEFENRLRDAEIQRLKQPLPRTEIQPGSRDVTTVNLPDGTIAPAPATAPAPAPAVSPGTAIVTPTPVITPRPSVAPAPVPLPVIAPSTLPSTSPDAEPLPAPSTSPAPSVTPTTSPNPDADILKLIQPAPAPSVSPAPQPAVRPAPVPRPKPGTPSRLPSLALPADVSEPSGGGTPSRPTTAQPGTGEELPIEETLPVEEPVEEPVPTPSEEPELPPVEDKTGTPVEKLYRPNLYIYGGTRPTTLPQTLRTSVENVPTAGTTTGTSVGLGGRGEIESKESGKKRKTVWNEESLRLKDALGL
jgi:hypothetical protein